VPDTSLRTPRYDDPENTTTRHVTQRVEGAP
jgi:hypothetical protein